MLRSIRFSSSITTIPKVPAGSTVFSLVQPTGRIHLGNYLGAIRNWKDLSSDCNQDTKFIFGLADLHALTLNQPAAVLKQGRYEAVASIIALGVDPEKCTLYHQSSVPEHSELNWILTCLTPMGHLQRMTTWKLKLSVSESKFGSELTVKAGLLCYPVLQASDILLYHSTHVPVGDDQTQHLELCRDLAEAFNRQYDLAGKGYFPLPKTLLTPTNKVLSLRNPSKKMSKSDADQNSCIYINESIDVISKKVRKATTDSIQGKITFDPIERPGVSNLINIIAGLQRKLIDETVQDLSYITNHKELKDHVVELLDSEFRDTRQLFDELTKNTQYLDKVCQQGTEKAREIASKNMKEVKKLVGLD